MKCRLLFSLAFGLARLFAQVASNDPSAQQLLKQTVKVVRVRGDAIALANLLGKSGMVEHQASAALRAIVLKGPASEVDSVERTIQELDNLSVGGSGGKNFELTAYVIGGSMESIPGTEDLSGEELGPVIKQIRAIFPYKHYQLLNTALIRSQVGSRAEVSGQIKGLSSSPDHGSSVLAYSLQHEGSSLSTGAPSFIHIPVLRYFLGGTSNTATQLSSIRISSAVDLQEGQKVVVGNANSADAGVCIFLVLSARLVQ